MSSQTIHKKLKLSRAEFISNGYLSSSEEIRSIILSSWKRCRAGGVNPELTHAPKVLDSSELEEKIQENETLVNIALPIMEKILEFVKGTEFIISLADKNGYLLKVIGDEDVTYSVRKGNFKPGANWNEMSIGTNAIGTSLVEKKPLQVFSYEHYCKCSIYWTCSAAPIKNPETGEIIGVLCMTGQYKKVHHHTLGIVYASSYAIENEITLRKAWFASEVANNENAKIFNSISEGIIATDEKGLVTLANKASCQLFGINESRILHQNIRNVLGVQNKSLLNLISEYNETTDKDVTIYNLLTQEKYKCTITIRLVKDENSNNTGKVIILSETKRVQKIAQQMIGNYAQFTFSDLIGENPSFKKSIELAKSASNSNSNVMLLGESGTGKELCAQAIHNSSQRKNGPFLAINCSGIPRELISSELFGYDEGAFTGAKKGGKPGKFELTHGGTLFLDEIGDMPLELQATLLRVLEEKRVMRLGSGKSIPIEVRIITATNKNLWHEVTKNNFRSDLFYRLNILTIKMIPLRERKDDIERLTYYILEKYYTIEESVYVSPDVLELFKKYTWPGNVRQLQNTIERMVNIRKDNVLTYELIPEEIIEDYNSLINEPTDSLENNEKYLIKSLLQKYNYNISEVSRNLDISRPTLYRKLKKYGLHQEKSTK